MPQKSMFETALTDVWTNAGDKGDKAGDLRWEGGRAFKCVQYTVAAVAGRAQKYANAAGYDAHQVRESTTATEIVAGVAMAASAINQFGWIQIRGPVTMAVSHSGTPGVGDALGSSATLGALGLWVTPDHAIAIALDATTRALLNCPY